MKQLMENWRKKLGDLEPMGINYEPGVTQDTPEKPLSGPDAILHKALTNWAEDWKVNLSATDEPVSLDQMPHPQREKLLTDLVEVFNVWSGRSLGTTQSEEEPPEEEAA
jgi:hypothetical protein|tara:strand:+ start:83 stop:409 length:327 start_codon:yes stop_codon:yes gene_type:complete